MDEETKRLLSDLAIFLGPIASGKTESPHYIKTEAESLIARIHSLIEASRE